MPADPYFTLPPDWVCETISPSTERIDRGKKIAIYANAGVGDLWLMNPGPATLEVFRLENGRWVLLSACEGDAAVRCEPFDAIEIDLKRLWGR
jgi:Uma2 family endonuclease